MKKISKRGKRNIAILLYIMVAVALYLLIYVVPKVSDIFVETYTVEYDTLTLSEDIDYLIVRDERIYTADKSGKVSREVSAGSLIRRNSRVINVGSTGHYSQDRGIVSFEYDGLEKKFNPESIDKITFSDLKPTQNEAGEPTYTMRKCKWDQVSKGDVIFRICDNSYWYLVSYVRPELSDFFSQGKKVNIELEGSRLAFTVDSVSEEYISEEYISDYDDLTDNVDNSEADEGTDNISANKSENSTEDSTAASTDSQSKDLTEGPAEESAGELYLKVVFKCDRYHENFAGLRYGTAKLILGEAEGIVINKEDVVETDGSIGVYVENKYGNAVFKPINILAEIDGNVVVSKDSFKNEKDEVVSTVRNYDKVFKQKHSLDG